MARSRMTRVARLALSAVLLSATLGLAGCEGLDDGGYLALVKAWLEDRDVDSSDADTAKGPVALSFTYPAGKSPKVFVKGWLFGAKCVVTTKGGTKDISDQVKWSGTGSFAPEVGARSRPTFEGPGVNTITLSVVHAGKTYTKTLRISAVGTGGYARLGDRAQCPADAHGCIAEPHPVVGPITQGSPNVYIDGRPAARKGDPGVHAACCGPNTFVITGGDPDVLINGRPAARKGSSTKHCGGVGEIIEASAGG